MPQLYIEQMKLEKVTLDETECFAPIFLDYINQKDALKPFYNTFPSVENFEKLIKDRQLSEDHRAILVHVLNRQYGALDKPEAVDFNIHSLGNDKTFTITTGHQLNIFTGPLYFIYKIVTVINACKSLKQQYPDCHFVPVYWMASEDHDLEEISHFNLFGKKYQWETDQKGPVGRMKPHSLNSVIDQLPESVPLFEQAYLDHDNLADAVRYYVNELFGDQGLVVVDADNPNIFAYSRTLNNDKVLIVGNLTDKVSQLNIDIDVKHTETLLHNYDKDINLNQIEPYEAFVLKL